MLWTDAERMAISVVKRDETTPLVSSPIAGKEQPVYVDTVPPSLSVSDTPV